MYVDCVRRVDARMLRIADDPWAGADFSIHKSDFIARRMGPLIKKRHRRPQPCRFSIEFYTAEESHLPLPGAESVGYVGNFTGDRKRAGSAIRA
jgi:hypothetical protein